MLQRLWAVFQTGKLQDTQRRVLKTREKVVLATSEAPKSSKQSFYCPTLPPEIKDVASSFVNNFLNVKLALKRQVVLQLPLCSLVHPNSPLDQSINIVKG